MLISDVDGVWTDGAVYKGTNDLELKKFSVLDGVGVAMAKAAKLKVALISGRYSSSTDHRPKEPNIQEVYNGYLNKIPAYKELKKKYKLSNHEIAYIGDDLIDIPIMEQVGFPISVNDANVKVKKISVFVTKVDGGKGAFREAVEWIIEKQGRTDEVFQIMKERILTS